MSKRKKQKQQPDFSDLRKTLKDVLDNSPITPHIFLECLVPIARGVRPASMVFMDQFNQEKLAALPMSPVVENSEWYNQVKLAANKYLGLETFHLLDTDAPLPIFPKVIFYKSNQTGKRLRRLNDNYTRIQPLTLQRQRPDEYFKGKTTEGRLLGIPDCCTQSYVQGRTTGQSIEQRVQQELRTLVPDVNDVDHLPIETLVVFWAHNIYPCRLDCQEAQMTGYKVLGSFRDQQIAEIYKEIVLVNNLKTIHTRDAVIKKPTRFPTTEDFYEKFNQGILAALGD